MALLIRYGLYATIATSLGALAGAVMNYLLLYRWTFSTRKPHGKTITAYTLSALLSNAVNSGTFHLLVVGLCAGVVAAQTASTAFVATMNFIIYKRVVFHERTA